MTNSHKNVINPFLESSTLLIMTFPEIVESKDRLWGGTCAVDNVRARRKGVRGKLYEIQISPERGLRNSLKFPSYFGMEYARPWNMGKKLLDIYHYRYQQHPHVSSAAVNPHLPGGGFFVGCGLGCECSPAALGPRTRSPKTRAPTPAKIKGIIGLFIT